jgi:hypothetical protein
MRACLIVTDARHSVSPSRWRGPGMFNRSEAHPKVGRMVSASSCQGTQKLMHCANFGWSDDFDERIGWFLFPLAFAHPQRPHMHSSFPGLPPPPPHFLHFPDVDDGVSNLLNESRHEVAELCFRRDRPHQGPSAQFPDFPISRRFPISIDFRISGISPRTPRMMRRDSRDLI